MDDLILALPLMEIAGVSSGYTSPVSLSLLEALVDASWLAIPSAVESDGLAVAIDIAVLLVRRVDSAAGGAPTWEWWCRADGRLIEAAPVTADDLARGEGISALRATARARAGTPRVELAGTLIDHARLGRRVVLVYHAFSTTDPTSEGAWLTPAALSRLELDPLSRLLADGARA